MSHNGPVLEERWCLYSWTHQDLVRLHQCWLELKHCHPSNSQPEPLSPGLLPSALTLVSITSSASYFAVVKDPCVHNLVIRDVFFIIIILFLRPAAPRLWPSHIKIQLNSTCLVLKSAKDDLYLFSKLLPFSKMRDRSPSQQFLTHLLAYAWTGKPSALMMKMM